MKAVVIEKFGDVEGSVLKEDFPIPKPNRDQVLIRVRAAGVNRPDILQRKGLYRVPITASPIMGLEVAGEIVEKGEDVSRRTIGEEVTALVPGGGYAEYVVTHHEHCLPIPEGYSFEQAAGLCECLFTVWINMITIGKIKGNEFFLIHGGSSGIGMFAIQLASFYGARVITSVRNREKANFCSDLGAEKVINYGEEDFHSVVKQHTHNYGVDLILDMIGGDYFKKNIDLLSDEGRLIIIAFLKGNEVNLDLSQIMLKRVVLTGSTLRPRSDVFKSRIAFKLQENVWPLLENGTIKSYTDSIYKLKDFKEAHRRMEESKHIGKIILSLD
jgi:putative PIG3 family NAD(P)H quinone oxidoreductase